MTPAELLAGFARLVSGARPRWLGCSPDPRPRVYFANHSSHLDAVVLWAVLPRELRGRTRPVAARDYWQADPLRRFLASRAFRAVLVDRQPAGFHQHPLEPLFEALDGGDSLILFPEGTRGTRGEPGEFRPGLHHLATERPDVELVPVHLSNLERSLPRGAHLPVPVISIVTFGTPMTRVPGEDRPTFLARAREAVRALGNP